MWGRWVSRAPGWWPPRPPCLLSALARHQPAFWAHACRQPSQASPHGCPLRGVACSSGGRWPSLLKIAGWPAHVPQTLDERAPGGHCPGAGGGRSPQGQGHKSRGCGARRQKQGLLGRRSLGPWLSEEPGTTLAAGPCARELPTCPAHARPGRE